MHRGPSVCNAAEEQHGVAHQWATSHVAPAPKRRPPTGRSRSGGTPHRERPAATLRACLPSRRTPVRRVFFERVAATLVGKPGAFFFFQAEDGIRDWSVTGVQTCALPI